MRVDGKFLAVNGKSNFDGTFTAVTQHEGKFLAVDGFPFFDGKFLAVDGNSNFDGKSPLYRDRPPVRYFYVGKFTAHLPGNCSGPTSFQILGKHSEERLRTGSKYLELWKFFVKNSLF